MVSVMIPQGTLAIVPNIQNGNLLTQCCEEPSAKLVLNEQLPLAIAQDCGYTQFRGLDL